MLKTNDKKDKKPSGQKEVAKKREAKAEGKVDQLKKKLIGAVNDAKSVTAVQGEIVLNEKRQLAVKAPAKVVKPEPPANKKSKKR